LFEFKKQKIEEIPKCNYEKMNLRYLRKNKSEKMPTHAHQKVLKIQKNKVFNA